MDVVGLIKKHEGFRKRMYKDTVGVPTIGYGFNLEQIELPKPVADLWFAYEIGKHEDELEQFDWYISLDPIRKGVLLNMHYNLGHSRFMQFKRMIGALKEIDYDQAAKEMLDSKWASQVPNRATELAKLMETDRNCE